MLGSWTLNDDGLLSLLIWNDQIKTKLLFNLNVTETCNEPGKQETFEDGIKRVGFRVLFHLVLYPVVHIVTET